MYTLSCTTPAAAKKAVPAGQAVHLDLYNSTAAKAAIAPRRPSPKPYQVRSTRPSAPQAGKPTCGNPKPYPNPTSGIDNWMSHPYLKPTAAAEDDMDRCRRRLPWMWMLVGDLDGFSASCPTEVERRRVGRS